jgi:hypothetical protein
MTSLNRYENIYPLVKGETIGDWKKIKKSKIDCGVFYTGPFATARGNPNFGYFPMIAKLIFLIYSLHFIASKNYKYSIYIILLYMIGNILNGIRFYYVNTHVTNGEDEKFINDVVYDNAIGAFIALVTILYILLKK